ncbi:hypothetical protein BGZ96_003252, partial [Linnemannia gamsii]
MARDLIQCDDQPNTDEEDDDPVADDIPCTIFLPNILFDANILHWDVNRLTNAKLEEYSRAISTNAAHRSV